MWFVWSKTSFDGDKWRCHHGDKQPNNQPESENRASQQIDKGLLGPQGHLGPVKMRALHANETVAKASIVTSSAC